MYLSGAASGPFVAVRYHFDEVCQSCWQCLNENLIKYVLEVHNATLFHH